MYLYVTVIELCEGLHIDKVHYPSYWL